VGRPAGSLRAWTPAGQPVWRPALPWVQSGLQSKSPPAEADGLCWNFAAIWGQLRRTSTLPMTAAAMAAATAGMTTA
jgi:hypothetical protein